MECRTKQVCENSGKRETCPHATRLTLALTAQMKWYAHNHYYALPAACDCPVRTPIEKLFNFARLCFTVSTLTNHKLLSNSQ